MPESRLKALKCRPVRPSTPNYVTYRRRLCSQPQAFAPCYGKRGVGCGRQGSGKDANDLDQFAEPKVASKWRFMFLYCCVWDKRAHHLALLQYDTSAGPKVTVAFTNF
ncbi:hypothetical protein MAPG_08925 [Magnaporthiopsis poae ATCC 64411]|uniref:Uncharacterized protein n=1 Tax=Magnaporthiopsis poae (strain ATCC 64411 / 73-15) TaxID=644358 RepID=A0A0C4E8L6_MAGP6|nr:hypothetical protein MAPG_08925 [Magnaporthiopsis poae ATCC 64411]